jgi:hypothetical protein
MATPEEKAQLRCNMEKRKKIKYDEVFIPWREKNPNPTREDIDTLMETLESLDIFDEEWTSKDCHVSLTMMHGLSKAHMALEKQ